MGLDPTRFISKSAFAFSTKQPTSCNGLKKSMYRRHIVVYQWVYCRELEFERLHTVIYIDDTFITTHKINCPLLIWL